MCQGWAPGGAGSALPGPGAAGPDRPPPHPIPPPLPSAVLPGAELRHDRLVRPHDLEGADGGDGQRKPHRGGAEVNPAGDGGGVAG